MAAELITGIGVFKSMMDMTKGLKDINDAAIRNAAVIELQEKILSAQAQQTTLVERVGQLEKHVADLETWNAEKQRYELKEFSPGVFAYSLKAAMRGAEPMHRLCTRCYQNSKKSVLQFEGEFLGSNVYHCHECGSKLSASAATRSRADTVPEPPSYPDA